MTDDNTQGIETMLYDRIGLDATTVGSSLVSRAVRRRMEIRGVGTSGEYTRVLASDDQEMQELVEEVVIPETYFFREPEALEAVAARLVAAPDAGTFRLLSAPCSTGEEPYSIAMTLLHAGLDPARFTVDGIDVSREATRKAMAGTYRRNAFRGAMGEWSRYFDRHEEAQVVKESVKSRVTIVQANLLSADFSCPHSSYDVIFCRNLLIYFDTLTQARVLLALSGKLGVDGVLVVGAADTFAVRRAGFVPLPGAERSFLFAREGAVADAESQVVAAPRKASRRRGAPVAQTRSPARVRTVPARAPAVAQPSPEPSPSAVEAITAFADRGKLDEALRLGERALEAEPENANLHVLVATLYSARGVGDLAEANYRRALYLAPDNAEALAHLALIVEQRGDTTAASRLRARAMRSVTGDRP